MDSARSWVLAAASCWINTFAFALFRASPVIYVGIMGTFRVTRQEAAWPLFLSGVFYSAMALGAGLLARRVAIWKLTLSGCLLSSLSVSVCFFANGIPYLTFFLGATHGCGIACLTLCNTVISQHFCRYRTVASGISNAGFTLGSFLYPPLLQFFLDEYGTKASLLLCGCVMLNATAGALLHRLPPSAPRKPVASFDIAATRLNCPRNDNTCGITRQDISDKSTNLFENEVGFASEVDDRLEEEDLTVCTDLANAEATGHLLEKNEAEALRQAGEPEEKCALKKGPLRKQHDRVFKTTLGTMSTGYFRDTLGNYQGLFFLIGGLTSLTASLWLWAFLREKEAPFSGGDSKSSSIARSPRCPRNSEG